VSYVDLDISSPSGIDSSGSHPWCWSARSRRTARYDLAPKHMVTPMGWDNYFGFVCAPRHATYRNVLRTKDSFTVSYLGPEPARAREPDGGASLRRGRKTVAPRPADRACRARVRAAPVRSVRAARVPPSIESSKRFGENGLIIGKIVAARVHRSAARAFELEDERLIEESPLLVYVAPGQYARVDESHSFPSRPASPPSGSSPKSLGIRAPLHPLGLRLPSSK
jgi:flavin reductase (DIM6/NTAB) family NADH-FMN oxidoreductase RutF